MTNLTTKLVLTVSRDSLTSRMSLSHATIKILQEGVAEEVSSNSTVDAVAVPKVVTKVVHKEAVQTAADSIATKSRSSNTSVTPATNSSTISYPSTTFKPDLQTFQVS